MKTPSKRTLARGRKLGRVKECILWVGWPLSCDLPKTLPTDMYGWTGTGFTAAGLAKMRLDWEAHKKRLLKKWDRKIKSYSGANIGRFPWGLYQLESAIPVPSGEKSTPGRVRPFKRKDT